MKTKILVFGLTKVVGGIESYIRNLILNMDREKFFFDFIVVGEDEKACFEDEFNHLFDDGKEHFYHCPDMKKNYLLTNRWLKKFYKTHYYDLIYMNVTTAARIMYCNYAVNKQNIPLITHSHCGNAVSWKASINNYLFRRYITKKSTVKLACSDEAFNYSFVCNKDDGQIITNGIDVNRFAFNRTDREKIRKMLQIKNDQIVIGHIGRFAKEKNQIYFVELSKKLGEKFVFVCVGKGELKENIIKIIKEKQVEENFRILPFTTETEKYYSMMDIFAMPSLYEGLPLVAVEAQASGLPCVFSDTISKQSDICGHSSFVSLSEIDTWIKTIRKQKIKRYDNRQCLIDKGFDITTTAKMVSIIFKKVRN